MKHTQLLVPLDSHNSWSTDSRDRPPQWHTEQKRAAPLLPVSRRTPQRRDRLCGRCVCMCVCACSGPDAPARMLSGREAPPLPGSSGREEAGCHPGGVDSDSQGNLRAGDKHSPAAVFSQVEKGGPSLLPAGSASAPRCRLSVRALHCYTCLPGTVLALACSSGHCGWRMVVELKEHL